MELFANLEFFIYFTGLGALVVVGLFLFPKAKTPILLAASGLTLYWVYQPAGKLPLFLSVIAYFMAVSLVHFFMVQKWSFSRIGPLSVILALLPLSWVRLSEYMDVETISLVGISYLTFRVLQFILETTDGLIKKVHPLKLLTFYIFMPTLSQGPIARSRHFESQLLPSKRAEYLAQVAQGIELILIGAVFKFVLADFTYGQLIQLPADNSFENLALYALAYGLFLYFDFSGYSKMAVGAAGVLGIRIEKNFKAPFIATNIGDFWNRWHISLSTWLRDFIFMRMVKRMSKNKALRKKRTLMAVVAYMVNMTLMGIWHGLHANFILYGFYHGLWLALYEVYKAYLPLEKRFGKNPLYKFAGWIFTMAGVFFGFLIFSGRLNFLFDRWGGLW